MVEKKFCDLCGLQIKTARITLKTNEGEKAFCCDGCRGIYQMLHQNKILPEIDKSK
jgi:hypothetical protein